MDQGSANRSRASHRADPLGAVLQQFGLTFAMAACSGSNSERSWGYTQSGSALRSRRAGRRSGGIPLPGGKANLARCYCLVMAYQPNQIELEGGIRHIVYEYGHLVFAGRHTLTAPGRPIDNLIQDAFLMNCRKLAEFFGRRSTAPEIKAAHYCTARQLPTVTLPTWKKCGMQSTTRLLT